jgi:hypothetical protein
MARNQLFISGENLLGLIKNDKMMTYWESPDLSEIVSSKAKVVCLSKEEQDKAEKKGVVFFTRKDLALLTRNRSIRDLTLELIGECCIEGVLNLREEPLMEFMGVALEEKPPSPLSNIAPLMNKMIDWSKIDPPSGF